jgi:hypothetical protein
VEPEDLDDRTASLYRSAAGSGIYLASDVEPITFAVKELARGLAKPNAEHWDDLARLGRWLWQHKDYLTENAVDEQTIAAYKAGGTLTIRCKHDSDWASSKVDRRSTTGIRVTIGGFKIAHSAGTQPGLAALSSAEAELRGMSKACCNAIFIRYVARELLIETQVVLEGDSTAAMANAAKLGPGRIRHLEVSQMAIKEAVRQRLVKLRKVLGTDNTADLHTKHVDFKTLQHHMLQLGFRLMTTVDREYRHCDQNSVNEMSTLKVLIDRSVKSDVVTALSSECIEGATAYVSSQYDSKLQDARHVPRGRVSKNTC